MTNSSRFFVSEPLEIRGEDSLYSLQTPPTSRATDLSTFRFFASLSSFVDNSTLSTECVSTSPTTDLCSKGKDEGYIYGGDIAVQRVPNYRQLVAGCQVEVLDVEFEYFDGTYTIVKDGAKAADNSTSLALNSVLYTRDARLNALGVALSTLASSGSSSAEVVRAFEEGVGKIMLSMGHNAFEPSSVLSLIWSVHVPATILPTAALALFIVILVLFAVLAIALGVLAIIGINKGLWEEKRRVDAALKRANQTTPQPQLQPQPPSLSYLRPQSQLAPDSCPPGLPLPRTLSPLGSSIREKDNAEHCA
ncbi:hypothetical protein FRC18_001506 [Serendipita sp. 400]|nr:hypothetical protein FRC18_001506 [Serendipita sp. 400]